jgi:hypothetical protein
MKPTKTQLGLLVTVAMFALQTFGVIPTADAPVTAPVPCVEAPNGGK